jgi:hypothetical protein
MASVPFKGGTGNLSHGVPISQSRGVKGNPTTSWLDSRGGGGPDLEGCDPNPVHIHGLGEVTGVDITPARVTGQVSTNGQVQHEVERPVEGRTRALGAPPRVGGKHVLAGQVMVLLAVKIPCHVVGSPLHCIAVGALQSSTQIRSELWVEKAWQDA